MTLPPEGAFHRAARPATALGAPALVWLAIVFVIAIIPAIVIAVYRWAFGHPIDLGGFAAAGGAIGGMIGVVMPLLLNVLNARSVERRDQIARGTAPEGPFASPPEGGPRQGDCP